MAGPGLANPGPVASALWTDDELEAGVSLDSIVTVVDARNLPRQLAQAPSEGGGANEAMQQIAYADLIILNKVPTTTWAPSSFAGGITV
jgi:G3E family GTPase